MSKSKSKDVVPQLSTNEKLEQIHSGRKLERRKSQLDIKQIIVSGKDGSKIIKKKVTEKYEETTVKRKKKNYVMYESILGTEKNTQIQSIEKPKPKSIPRTPGPRREEKIITVKKRKDYLDNYQYLETKVFRKNKKPSVVIHKRLESAPNIIQSQSQYQTLTTENSGKGNGRIHINKPDKLKQPAATATDFYKRPAQTETNFYKKQIPVVVYDRNDRNRKKDSIKTETVTKQIMSRKAPQSKEGKTEVIQTSTVRRRGRDQAPGENTTVITKEAIEHKEDTNGPRKKYQEIKVKERSRREKKEEDNSKN